MIPLKRPFRQIIRDQIAADIIEGKINAGVKLLESDLSRRFQVSRTPVREALLQLHQEGYVTHEKNIGATVREISVKEVGEIYDVLAQLEAFATELATDNLKRKDILYLRNLLKRMEVANRKRNYSDYVRDNLEFHQYILKKCGNETLQRIVLDLRKRIYNLISRGLTLPKHADRYLEWHREIVDAIERKDPTKAGKMVKAHINEVRNRFSEETEIT